MRKKWRFRIMALVNPFEESRRRRGKPAKARRRRPVEAANCRKCVNPKCGGDMSLAASRGHRVLVCMSCMTSLPVTSEWQVTGERPPKGGVDEQAGMAAGKPIDIHRALRRKDMELSAGGAVLERAGISDTLDTSWLKPASAKLNISPSIKDYVMVPVILFYASVPNRNGLGFLEKDLVEWSTEHKAPAYKTWRGSPMHIEHDNKDPSKAVGVVLDTFMRKHEAEPIPFWKNIAYLAVDRGKDQDVAKRVLKREISTYSMGCYVNGGYRCSVCEQSSCGHIMPPTARSKRFALIEGGVAIDSGSAGAKRTLMDESRHHGNDALPDLPVLAFPVAKEPVGFEVSLVETPAFPMAGNDNLQIW